MSVASKLLIKPGHRVGLVKAPPGYAKVLDPLPDGARVVRDDAGLDAVLVFARTTAEVDERVPAASRALKTAGLLWVAYPKGGAKAGTDLHRDVLWQRLAARGLEGVSLVALDDTWSAMRFKPKP